MFLSYVWHYFFLIYAKSFYIRHDSDVYYCLSDVRASLVSYKLSHRIFLDEEYYVNVLWRTFLFAFTSLKTHNRNLTLGDF